MRERFSYRAWKWAIQQFSTTRESNQLARLNAVDWDVVVILDACRVDTLRLYADWPIESTVSPASCTPQWLQVVAGWDGFADAHVISGNPQYDRVDPGLNCASIEHYWDSHWNTSLQTTLPEPILERADELIGQVPGVVTHLQQPHWPYVAKLGDEWLLAYDDLGPWSVGTDETDSVQVAMQRGLIDVSTAKRAYEASIRSVWKTLASYLSEWVDQGFTAIVTADHGETFGQLGDYAFYEHPCKCHVAPLVTVPWVRLSAPEEVQRGDEVTDRLRALGYAE